MKYYIKYEQRYYGNIIVEANSEEEAKDKAIEAVECGDDVDIIDSEVNLLEVVDIK